MSTIAPLASKLTLNVSEFSTGVARAEADAARLAKKLEQQKKNFGLSGTDLKISKLTDNGASDATIAKLKAINDQLALQKKQATEFAAAQTKAAALTESVLSPMERHVAKQKELNGLLKQGLITEQTYKRAVEQSSAALRDSAASAAKRGLTGANELLRGGGVAAVFQFAGQQLNQGLDKVAAVQQQVAEGSLSMSEGIEEGAVQMVRTLPIAGQFFQAGEKIRGMLDGSAAAQVKLTREMAAHEALMKAQMAAHDMLTKSAGEAEQATVSLWRARQQALAGTPADQMRVSAQFDFADTMGKANEMRKQLDAILSGDPAVVKANSDEITRLRTAIASMEGQARMTLDLAQSSARALERKPIEDFLARVIADAGKAGRTEREKLEADLRALRGISEEDVQFGLAKFDEGQTLQTAGEQLKAATEKAEKFTKSLADLESQAARLGMSKVESEVAKFAAEGATAEQVERWRAATQAIEDHRLAQERLNKARSDAKSVIEQTQTAQEKYHAKTTRLSELLSEKLITWEVYGRAVRAAREELEKNGKTGTKLAEAAKSVAPAVTMRFTAGAPGGSTPAENRDMKALVALTRTQNDLLRPVSEAAKKPAAVTHVSIGS